MKQLMASIACAGVLAMSVPAWGNLITNPGFEIDGAFSTSGWTNPTQVEDLGTGFGGSDHAAHIVGTPSSNTDFFRLNLNTAFWDGYSSDTYEVSFDIATQQDPEATSGNFGAYVFLRFGAFNVSSSPNFHLSVNREGELRLFNQGEGFIVISDPIIEPSDFDDLENSLNVYRFRVLFDRSGESTSYVVQVLEDDSVLFTSESLSYYQNTTGDPGSTLPAFLIFTRQTSANSFAVDNVYIGQVIPEPTSLALFGLAGGLTLLRRRRTV